VVDGQELGVCGLRRLLRRSISPQAVLEDLESADDVTLVVLRR
jgi:hypothetical protein